MPRPADTCGLGRGCRGLGQLDTARRIVRSLGPGEPSELERRAVERARDAVIRVDAFDPEEYAQLRR